MTVYMIRSPLMRAGSQQEASSAQPAEVSVTHTTSAGGGLEYSRSLGPKNVERCRASGSFMPESWMHDGAFAFFFWHINANDWGTVL